MDGARFANALEFLGCTPADITWRAGVDVLSFDATKNGALAAEAVVFFDSGLVRDFELRRKRAGHLLSKSRYIAAQLLTYVESGVALRNAQHTNRLAQAVGRASGAALLHLVEANEVFVQLGVDRRHALRAAGFEFYDLGPPGRRCGALRRLVGPAQSGRRSVVRGAVPCLRIGIRTGLPHPQSCWTTLRDRYFVHGAQVSGSRAYPSIAALTIVEEVARCCARRCNAATVI
jgi:Beta-eliminating lyase